jgi:hypothetical protein
MGRVLCSKPLRFSTLAHSHSLSFLVIRLACRCLSHKICALHCAVRATGDVWCYAYPDYEDTVSIPCDGLSAMTHMGYAASSTALPGIAARLSGRPTGQ